MGQNALGGFELDCMGFSSSGTTLLRNYPRRAPSGKRATRSWWKPRWVAAGSCARHCQRSYSDHDTQKCGVAGTDRDDSHDGSALTLLWAYRTQSRTYSRLRIHRPHFIARQYLDIECEFLYVSNFVHAQIASDFVVQIYVDRHQVGSSTVT